MNTIYNPLNKTTINLNTKQAKNLLKKYISQYNLIGGGKKKQKHFTNVEPQTILNMFRNKKIAIVNSLSEDLFINTKHKHSI